MVEGLLAFSRGFKGKIWLEVFLLAGMTDSPEEVERIAAVAERMRPDRIQLNTVSRPASERCALAVPKHSLESLGKLFVGHCEVIAESRADPVTAACDRPDLDDEIEALISRRPCTVEGIAAGLGLAPNEVLKRLEQLCATGTVRAERRGDAVYYERARR
jgi:wyosine [tRNA(Phe)-imidazoG37] synthetase (radical SAM superfamily)